MEKLYTGPPHITIPSIYPFELSFAHQSILRIHDSGAAVNYWIFEISKFLNGKEKARSEA